jgi:hypothetical protein
VERIWSSSQEIAHVLRHPNNNNFRLHGIPALDRTLRYLNAADNPTPSFFLTSDVFLVFLTRAVSPSYLMVLDVLHLFYSAQQQPRLPCKVLMPEWSLATSLHAPPVTHNSICLQRAAEVLPPAEWTCVMSFGCATNDQRPSYMQLKLCCSSKQPRVTQCLE